MGIQAADDNIIRRIRIACWIPKATDTHSDYLIFIVFPRQQWLHERTSKLCHTYIACHIILSSHLRLRRNHNNVFYISPQLLHTVTIIRHCSFVTVTVCLTTGPKPLPNRALHIVRSKASSSICEYPLLSLRSSSSFLHLLSRLPITSISPFIFP